MADQISKLIRRATAPVLSLKGAELSQIEALKYLHDRKLSMLGSLMNPGRAQRWVITFHLTSITNVSNYLFVQL